MAKVFDVGKDLFSQVYSMGKSMFNRSTARDGTGLFDEEHGTPRRLMTTVRRAYEDMQPFRQLAVDGLSQLASRYGWRAEHGVDTGEDRVAPIGKLRQFTRVTTHLLASGTPQASVGTKFMELKAFAEDFEVDLNRSLRECKLGDAMRLGTLHALFWAGFFKTGLAEGIEAFEVEGQFCDPGTCCTSAVHYNNAVIDVQAESLDRIDFVGDRYRMPKAWVEAMREKDSAGAIEILTNSQMQPERRVSGIEEQHEGRLYEEVWCWDIYLPKQNLMCLYLDSEDRPIQVYEWDGPEGGPYDILGFEWVAGEVLPSSPAAALEPLHNFVNHMARKVERQARRAKEIDVYDAGNQEDAERIREARDGQLTGLVNPESVKSLKFGGPDPLLLNTIMQFDQIFDTQAGGLDVLGGTEAMSETYRQDKLLHESASVQVNQMRAAVMRVSRSIINKHGWYRWTEPLRPLSGTFTVPGTGFARPVNISPEVREGDFIQYSLDINPYSLRELTPMELAAQLMDVWDRVVLPNMQLYQAEGQIPSAVEYTKKIFELMDLQFSDLFVSMEGTEQLEDGGKQVPWPKQFGDNVNTRVSVAGRTKKGRQAQLMAANSRMSTSNAVGGEAG